MSVGVKLRGSVPAKTTEHFATVKNIQGGYEARCAPCNARERLLIPDGVPVHVFLTSVKSFNRRHRSRRRARPT